MTSSDGLLTVTGRLAVTQQPRSPTRHDAHATNGHSQKVSTHSLRCRLLLCLIEIIGPTPYSKSICSWLCAINGDVLFVRGVQGPNVEATSDFIDQQTCCFEIALNFITAAFLIWTAILHCRLYTFCVCNVRCSASFGQWTFFL